MVDTIGRVQFIVSFNGKNLSREARRIAKQFGEEGDHAGKEFGTAADKAAADEFGLRLSKAGDKAARKLGGKGKLAGNTYAKNIEKAVLKVFRKMERETAEALASKEGFDRFVKNAGSAEKAIEQLKKNVNLLSKEVVKVGNKKISFFGESDQEGWLTTIKRIQEFGSAALQTEAETERFRQQVEKTRLDIDKFRMSLDNDTFDKVAKQMGGASAAAEKYRGRLSELRETGELTEIQFQRLQVAIDKQVNRTEAAIQKEKDHQDALDKAKDAADRKAKSLDLLDRRLADLDRRMGNRKAFEKYVSSVGDVDRANGRLSGSITAIERMGIMSARSIGNLRRKLGDLTEGFGEVGDAAGDAAKGGMSKFGDLIKKMAGNKGGMSIGAIVALIGSLGASLSALGSGASAALVGLISALGVGLVGAAAAAGAAIAGIAWTALHAMKAIELMGEEFPKAQAGMDRLARAAENDSRAFARAWGPALADFTNKLAQLWEDDLMGERAGEALGKVTAAFTAVLNSPSYLAFQTAMETTIPNSIALLGEGAAKLAEGLLQVFGVVGPFLEELSGKFRDWADSWNASIQEAASNGEMQRFFDLAFESIDKLFGLIGALGGAFGTIFTAGAPAGNEMLQSLTDAINKWNGWLQGEGSAALQTWFDNGAKFFDIFLDLIKQVSEQFAGMVTPEIMEDSLNALSNLGDGLQVIFDIFQILGGLDVLGNVIAAFEALSAFLTPMTEPLYAIADAIGNLLLGALEAIIPIFAAAGEVLAPFIEAIALIVTTIVEGLLPVFTALSPAITALVEAFVPIAELIANVVVKAFEILWPIIQIVIDFIVELIEALTPLIEEALPVVAALVEALSAVLDFLWPIIRQVAGVIMGILKVAFTIIIEVIKIVVDIIGNLLDMFGDLVSWVTDKLTPVFDAFSGFMEDIWDNIQDTIDTAVDNIVGFFKGIKKVVDDAIGWFRNLFGAANDAKNASKNANKEAGKSSLTFSRGGAGGVLLQFPPQPTPTTAGMPAPAGTSFTTTDPSVRALSRSMRDLSLNVSGGGGGRDVRVLNINPGAIVVQGAMAPEATATMTVNRIAERLA